MSDEIDIEEHDLLDDPAIKNIFPDLSKLKQEIIDYYEEEEPELETASSFQTALISEIDNHAESNVSACLSVFEDNILQHGAFLDNSQVSEVEPHHRTTETTQVQLFDNKINLVTTHEDCSVKTSLNVFEDEGLPLDNLSENSQDNEVEQNHLTTEKTQIQQFYNNIIVSTNHEDCIVRTSSNVFEDEGLPLDNLSENSKDNEVGPNHLATEKIHIQLFDNKIILAMDQRDCKISTSLKDFKSESLPSGNLSNDSQGSKVESQHVTTEKTQVKLLGNKIILGTDHENKNVVTSSNVFINGSPSLDNLLDNSQDSEVEPLYFTTENTQVDLYTNICNNKIILGSKPIQRVQKKTEYNKENVKLYSAVVKLVEYGDYLNKSSRYCKDCQILFPKQNDFEFHNQCKHIVSETPPVVSAITRSITPETLSVVPLVTRIKRNSIKKKLILKGNVTKHKCVLCSAVFASSSNLSRHKKNVHNKIYHPKLNKIKKRNMQQNQKKMVKNNECFHCKKNFKDQKSLIEHIYSILQKPTGSLITGDNKNNVNQKSDDVLISKNKNIQVHNSAKKAEKGNKIVIQKTKNIPLKNVVTKAEMGNKSVNQKIKTNSELKSPKVDQGDTFYRCHYCSYYFNTIKFYAAHVKNKHQLVKVPKVKKIPFNPKCKFCLSVHNTPQTFNIHLHKRHTAKIQETFAISKTLKKENKMNNLKKATTATRSINTKTSGSLDVFRCCYCSYYYINVKCYTKHVIKNHKVQKIPMAKKISFDPKCKYCPKLSSNIRSYNKHIYKSHSKRLHEVFKITPKDQFSSIKNRVVGKSKEKVTKKNSYNDNSDERQNSRKDVKSDGMINAPKSKNLILKSALFKCNKCDIHFLSLKTAVDHTNHMELLINWKCAVCYKIFKRNDKQLHEKQHTMSNIFTVYEISEKDVSKVLYKCSKCTIHFDQNNYWSHCSDCNVKTPQSTYCNICDILVAKIGIKSHEIKHKTFKSNDFIVIDSDFIFHTELNKLNGGIESRLKTVIDKVSSETTSTKVSDIKKTKKLNYFLTQSYCDTCKCFVSNVGGTRKVHVHSACSHMTRHTCLDCGLTLTNKAMVTHQKLHSIKRDLKLQDYTFYNLKTGKQINPPIPDYHKCETCNIHFISKIIMRSHLCNEKEYRTCQICDIKLSKPIYHIHMAFHLYSMRKVNDTQSKNYKRSSEVLEISESSIPTPNKLLKRSPIYFVYTCNNCNTTVDTYDKMIQHCQEHSANKSMVSSTKECKICKLNFDTKCYTAHNNFHQTIVKLSLEKLNYDLFYFRLGNDVWLSHVFGSRQEQAKEVIKTSIYRSEHRVKMEVVQEGASDYTMYKCNKCHCVIEPDNIYKHSDLMCVKLRKYPCSACGLSFISTLFRKNHEKWHERPDFSSKSYRLVLFNRTEDSNLLSSSMGPHDCYVFYQCRKCSGIVDKSHRTDHICIEMKYKNCTYCGLLFNKNEYESHILKHKTLNSFVSENMKVILFGKNNSDKIGTSNKLKESFRGIIYDYNFMKCINCQICEKDAKFNHICAYDNSRIKCSKCYIYLYSHALVSHLKKHESDPDFEIENMNFIDFDPTELANNNKVTNSDEHLVNEEFFDKLKTIPGGTHPEISHPGKGNEDPAAQKIAKIYKCPCGLHFLDEVTIGTHLDQCGSKIKQAKKNCFKCGLLFTPKVLFSHMLIHHGDIKNMLKFDIIDVPKK